MSEEKWNLSTKCVRSGWKPEKGEPLQLPIYQSTTFKYESSQQMQDLFDLKAAGYFYSRLQNPTNDFTAQRICALEGGVAAMLTSSGQAANFFAVFNICEAGDHFIACSALYGGTYNLFAVTLKKMGIDVTFVPINATDEEVQAAIKPNTKLIFGETLTNPSIEIFDIERFANIAHSNGIPLVIDNTFPTPINCRPIEWGADIVTHSTTKYMDGHNTVVGGCIVDSGNFDWEANKERFPGLTEPDPSYHGVSYSKTFGKGAYITKATVQLMRDLGCSQSPHSAFLINLGLETLAVRIKQHNENAEKVATFLESHPKVSWIHYPKLKSYANNELAEKYLPNGSSGVMSLAIEGGTEKSIKFMDSLQLVNIVTHVAFSQSCILHPASHTHRQLSDEELLAAGVNPELIRLSVGIENVDDIIADLAQALDKI